MLMPADLHGVLTHVLLLGHFLTSADVHACLGLCSPPFGVAKSVANSKHGRPAVPQEDWKAGVSLQPL